MSSDKYYINTIILNIIFPVKINKDEISAQGNETALSESLRNVLLCGYIENPTQAKFLGALEVISIFKHGLIYYRMKVS